MEQYIQYAPIVIVVVGFIIQHRIFMTPADFQKARADFIQYIAEHYVTDKTYREGHKEVQEQLRQLQNDISDIKTLLIKGR